MNNEQNHFILLIEDNPGDARLLREMFKEQHMDTCKLIHVAQMSEAEAHLENHAVDIILLDLGLPDANGLEAVRRARKLAPGIPIVVMTGMDDESMAIQALKEGAQDYLVKGQVETRGLRCAVRYAIERKAMEDAVFAEKERAQATLNCIGDAVACTDIEEYITFFNPAAIAMTGCPLDEAIGQKFADVFSILDVENRQATADFITMKLGRSGMGRLAQNWLLISRDGTEIPIEDSVAPIHDRVGQRTGAVIVFHNVTERRRKDSEIQKSEERFRLLVSGVKDYSILMLDPEGLIANWNLGAERIKGYHADEIIGQNFSCFYSAEDIAADKPGMELRVARTEGRYEEEGWLLRKDGSRFWAHVVITALHDENGELRGFSKITRDISERWHKDKLLRKSEERFRKLFESSTMGIMIANLSGRILEANDAFLEMVCYTHEDVRETELRWDVLTPYESAVDDQTAIAQLRTTGVAQTYEKEFLRKDQSRVPVLFGAAMLESSEDTCIAFIVDLSSRRLLEEQLRQSQKMDAIGQLAGGVAHDFNNLLTVILGYADIMESELTNHDGLDSLRESIEEVRNAGERAAALTRQLLAFSRRQVLDPKILDLNELVVNLKKMLRRMIGEDIDFITPRVPGIGRVRADAMQIEQVLINLAVNARDAMPRGGRLSIELKNVELDAAYTHEHQCAEPGRYVMIAVTDTGTGMSDEIKAHIFEPFYTTKGIGEGTGLGLATVYGIVKQSGGNIWVYSELGRGTIFKIYLPRQETVADGVEKIAPTVSAARATETILLVEDELAVRVLTRRLLEAHGYTVIEALTPEHALEIAQEHTGPIHLLLTDVIMPQMGGPELASVMSLQLPELRVIFMSGYTDDAVFRQGLLTDKVNFIQKPFSSDSLALKLRESLA